MKFRMLLLFLLALHLSGAEIALPSQAGVLKNAPAITTAASGVVTLKIDRVSNSTADQDAYFDAFFYSHLRFVFGRRGDRLYFNFHDGKQWVAFIDGAPERRLEPGKFHQVAFVLQVHEEPSQGELWTDVLLYLDGAPAATRRLQGIKPQLNREPVEFGQAPRFGNGWTFHGELGGGKFFDRALSAAEVARFALADRRITPAVEVRPELGDAQRSRLDALDALAAQAPEAIHPHVGALRGALAWLGCHGAKADFASAAAAVEAWLRSGAAELPSRIGPLVLFAGPESTLVLWHDPATSRAAIACWFDRRAKRELLAFDNDFWTLSVREGQGVRQHSGRRRMASKLTQSAGETFTLTWLDPALTVTMDCRFAADRFEYRIDARISGGDVRIEEAGFPVLSLAPLGGDGTLLIPSMSGALIPDALKNHGNFNGSYPTGHVSMQLGAWYDRAGGLYFAAEDGRARAKNFSFQAAGDRMKAGVYWPVAYPAPGQSSSFAPGCPAVLELLRGDWYDAGLIYRKFLQSKAVWYTPGGRAEKYPEWFRTNTLWLVLNYQDRAPAQLAKLRRYFDLPFAAHYYNWIGKFDRDYPHHRPNPESWQRFRELRKLGVRVVPYSNGRLWETLDRRDEDFQYSRFGKPNAVKDATGNAITESYQRATFGVMCPSTPLWQARLGQLVDEVLGLGVDGLYLDQIAAARPRLCSDPAHPHPANDGDAWYMGGYRVLLQKIRAAMHERHPDAVLTSEDNAEPYAGLMDGLLAWRWMVDHYVPLFPLCYADQAEVVGRAFGAGDADARIAKFANQLVNGEQLGWCSLGLLAAPDQQLLRAYVKRAMHIRLALLGYFQQGLLARPPELAEKQSKLLRWGNYASKLVTTPAIESAAWRRGNLEILLLCNTTPESRNGAFRRPLPSGAMRRCFSTHRVQAAPETPLVPGEIRLVLTGIGPEFTAENARLEAVFAKIRTFAADTDPFAPQPTGELHR